MESTSELWAIVTPNETYIARNWESATIYRKKHPYPLVMKRCQSEAEATLWAEQRRESLKDSGQYMGLDDLIAMNIYS